jgi:hypothetical protein
MMELWVTPASAETGEEPVPTADFRSYLDQARFFLKKEWYRDAREQLELAVATEDGRLDPEAWFLLAKVRFELGDLVGARHAADEALTRSRNDEQARQTRELLEFFEQKFGYVTIVAPYDGMSTTLSVTLESTIFDPELKIWLNNLIAALDEPVVLPFELGLPSGSYTINGETVQVSPGAHASIAPKLRSKAPNALQVLQLELGLGGTGFVGAAGSNLVMAPTTELSLGMPLGIVVIGAGFGWMPQLYTTQVGGLNPALGGWNGAFRLGLEVPGTQPFVLRPSLEYRIGVLPGLELPCADSGADTGETQWTCSPGSPVQELFVYTSGLTHTAGLELAALYQDRSKRGGLGFGLKVGGGTVFANLPAEGQAEGPDGPLAFEVTGARSVMMGTWRAQVVGSYAF